VWIRPLIVLIFPLHAPMAIPGEGAVQGQQPAQVIGMYCARARRFTGW
jgi:hypothetical protein